MNAITDLLRKEHDLIRRASTCLSLAAEETREHRELSVLTAIALLEFFEDFADGCHQVKEERCLFPALLERGLARHRIRELERGHVEERRLLGSMRRYLEAAACGCPRGRSDFAQAALSYAALEREHADEEDRFLMPLIEEYLDEADQREVLARFRKVDGELLPRPRGRYAAIVARAEERMRSTLGTGPWWE